MLRVQSLDHNLITGTFRVESCTPAGPNAAQQSAARDNTWWASAGAGG